MQRTKSVLWMKEQIVSIARPRGLCYNRDGIICLPRRASFPVDESYEEPGMTQRNRTRRTPFILFVVLLITMLALAGCGGNKEEQTQESAKKPFLLPRVTVNIAEDGSP